MSTATDTTPAVETPTAETPRISEMTTDFAQVLAFENIVKDLSNARRAQLYDRLREQHEDTGGKSFQAKATDGTVMAEFVLTDSSETFKVTDAAKFADWVMDNFPTEAKISYTLLPEALDQLVAEHPECFDMTITVQPAFSKGLLTAKRLIPTDEGVIDKETGVVVDGVTHTKAETATGMTTKWKAENDGKALAAASLLEGAAERLFTSYVETVAGELEAGQA